MNDIAKAEQTITALEDKRRQLVERRIVLNYEMQQTSYGAHTGDKAARLKLDKLKAEQAVFEGEYTSIEAAIAEARQRLAQAQQAEVSVADRAKAQQIIELNAKLKEQLDDADAAFLDAIESVLTARALLQEMHGLGVGSPTDQLFRINAVAAIKTAIQKLPEPWIRDFEYSRLAPSQKKNFKDIANGWFTQIANQTAARLPKKEDKAA